MNRKDAEPSLIDKLENLEGRARRDFFGGDYRHADRLPEPSQCARRIIHSSAKLAAYDLTNTESKAVTERRLFSLVDAVACLLAHGGRYGGEETARLALEIVVEPSVARVAVRTLTDGGDRA